MNKLIGIHRPTMTFDKITECPYIDYNCYKEMFQTLVKLGYIGDFRNRVENAQLDGIIGPSEARHIISMMEFSIEHGLVLELNKTEIN